MRPSGAGLMNDSPPKKFEHKRTHRTKSSDSQERGTAYHSFLFGGAEAEVMPFENKRTNAAKQWWIDCQNRGNVPLRKDSEEEHIRNAAEASRAAILDRFGVPEKDWICEKTFYWISECGTPCRGSTDLILPLAGAPMILEGKSWDDCSTFERQVGAKNWDAQRAGYIEAVAKFFGVKRSDVGHEFIAQELSAPYCLKFVPASWDAHEVGANKWRSACLKHLEANTTENGWAKDFEDGMQEATPWDLKKWGDLQI